MKRPELKFSSVKPLVEYLQKQRDNEKFYRSLETVATFLLISFFLYFAIRPTVFTISSLLGEIKSKEVLSKSLRGKINQVVDAQDSFSQIQERYLVINSALPDSPKYSHLLSQVYQSAQNTSVPFSSLDFSLKEIKEKNNLNKNLKSYAVNSVVSSSYPSLLNFVSDLSLNRRLINLKQLNLQTVRTKESSSSSSLSATIKADVYYWQQDE